MCRVLASVNPFKVTLDLRSNRGPPLRIGFVAGGEQPLGKFDAFVQLQFEGGGEERVYCGHDDILPVAAARSDNAHVAWYPRLVEYLKVETQPTLKAPIVVCAFAGWNDAASAATNAARFIVRRLGARKFASIDAEPFYDFKETRPTVRITARGDRDLNWPSNDFFYARNPTGEHDVVVFIGTEPALRWRSFAQAHTSLFRDVGADLVVSLGALLADVPHSRPVRVTGSAMDPNVSDRLDLQPSRYEGPTGIVGVLHDSLRVAEVPGASLWANVPHYITTSQNPPATAALLRRLQTIIGMEFDLSELDSAGERFVDEVNTALSGNPEVQDYVHQLEEAVDTGADAEPQSQLPRPEELLLDVEEFLRGQQRESGED